MVYRGVLAAMAAALLLASSGVTGTFAKDGEGSGFSKTRDLMRKQKGKTRRAPSIFSFFGSPGSDEGVRIITGTKRQKSASKKPKAAIAVIDPEPEPSPYRDLTYVPEPLVPLRAAKFEAAKPEGGLPAAIFAALTNKNQSVRVSEEERSALLKDYETAAFAPNWITSEGLSPRALTVLRLLATAEEEGLAASDYLPASLSGFSDDGARLKGDPEGLARLDLEFSAAALAYARHASSGRIVPNRLSTYYDIPTRPADAVVVARLMRFSPYPETYLASLQPSHPAYAAFKAELAKLQAAGLADDAPIEGGKRLKPGQSDARVAAVRRQLERLGYLSAATDGPEFGAEGSERLSTQTGGGGAPEEFDPVLEAAVKAFQTASKIKTTGMIDAPTVEALNSLSPASVIRRLTLNMDRMRWLPRDLGTRHVLVNQAAFELKVMDKGAEVWRTNVVVGRRDTQTVAFHDELEMIVFNPSWGVPPSIMRNEYLPKLRRNPGYLDKIGFKVVGANGKPVKSSSVAWSSYDPAKLPFSVLQPPGGENALGEVKFLFPNGHHIYMHDTPARNLFEKDVRAFSHGCIRVQNPRVFAEVLTGLPQEEVARRIESGESQTMRLSSRVPVHITYFTAWPGEDGRISYYSDVYGRDGLMEKARLDKTAASR